MQPMIQDGTVADLAAIQVVYNRYVAVSTCTYQESPEPMESRRVWFDRRGDWASDRRGGD